MSVWLALYQLLFPLVGVAVAAKMLAAGRGSTLREGWAELRERLGRLDAALLERIRGGLWVHAASVGELAAAEPLLRALKPAIPVFITTSTVAGRRRAASLPNVQAAILAPMDFLPVVRRFLAGVRPRALIILETELWPATLAASSQAGVPFAVVNARMSARSFPRYRLLGGLFRPLLARAAAVAAQSEPDAGRFRALGVPAERVRSTGNLKYDALGATAESRDKARALFDRLGWSDTDAVFCAGSTRPGDEEKAVLDAFDELRRVRPGTKLILAPRHVERAAEVAAELRRRAIGYRTASNAGAPCECLLVDSLGVLAGLYGLSRFAFVGGTLLPVGGHNILEPAAEGTPVLYGPSLDSVAEPARILEEEGGGFRVRDGRALAATAECLLADPAALAKAADGARRAAKRCAGAAGRAAELLGSTLAL